MEVRAAPAARRTPWVALGTALALALAATWQLLPLRAHALRTPLLSPALQRAAACLATRAPPPAATVDVLIFSKDRPLQLLALLESQARHVAHAGAVAVVVRATSAETAAGYQLVAALHPSVHFEWQAQASRDWLGRAAFRRSVVAALAVLRAPFVAPLVDEVVWLRPVDLADVASALAQLGGQGTFQLRLGLHYTNAAAAKPREWRAGAPGRPRVSCYEWTSRTMQPPNFAYTAIVDAGVYPAARLRREWAAIGGYRGYHHPGELEGGWYDAQPGYAPGCVHLLYDNSSVVNNERSDSAGRVVTVRDDYAGSAGPDNQRALLNDTRALLAGWRLDTAPFDGMLPPYGHVRVPLRLVPLVAPGSGCVDPRSPGG